MPGSPAEEAALVPGDIIIEMDKKSVKDFKTLNNLKEKAVMKKLGIWMISAVCIVGINTVWADEGETIFKSQGCMSCHKKESASKVNPSLTEISQAYQGKEAQLTQYLKGESNAIVRPEKGSLMKRKIEKIKALTDSDRKALADFILSH